MNLDIELVNAEVQLKINQLASDGTLAIGLGIGQTECRRRMMRNGCRSLSYFCCFNGVCYSCNTYVHKYFECRTNKIFRNKKMSGGKSQRGPVCHNCNTMDHITKYCRSGNEKSNAPKKKIDINE